MRSYPNRFDTNDSSFPSIPVWEPNPWLFDQKVDIDGFIDEIDQILPPSQDNVDDDGEEIVWN